MALLLARTDDTVVGSTDVRGYPNGFVFLLRLRWAWSPTPYEQLPWPFPDWGSPDPLDGDLFPRSCCALGSSSPTAAGSPTWTATPSCPRICRRDQPVLVEGGGVGSEGGRLGRGAFWDLEPAVQSLPPPGRWPLCAWPGRGIPESRVETDARLILDAAAAARPFFAEVRS